MDLGKQDKIEQLENVLQSRTFQGSENLRAFLRYVVTKSVDDGGASLKEYTIASEVFGQGNYDPRIDSTVRVQAGRLRNKLQEYYATEGRRDAIVIELPKGHYTPTFSYVQKPATLAAPPAPPAEIITQHDDHPVSGNGSSVRPAPAEEVPEQTVEPATPGRSVEPRRVRWPAPTIIAYAALTGLVLGLGFLVFKYRAEAQRRQPLAAITADPAQKRALLLLWGDFFNSSHPILISFSNTLFERRSDLTLVYTRPLAHGENTLPASPKETSAPAADPDVIDYYTGVGEVMGAAALTKFFTKSEHPFRVRRSLLLSWDDVKNENIVMLGSPVENLLLRNLPQAQDFEFRSNNELGVIELINLRPQPGEEDVYRPRIERVRGEGPATMTVKEDYALVSLIKGLGEQNKLFILAGITTHGTHAAAEYVTKPEHVKELLDRLTDASPNGLPPASYQAVLKVKVNGGVPVQISYVTHHALEN